MTLPRLSLLLVPSVLALAMPTLAEARQGSANIVQPRPLNLSLPRDPPHPPGTSPVDEAVQRNLRAPTPTQDSRQAPVRLPYGAGYEHRHPEMGGAAPGISPGTAPGAGTGRRGR
ncbi:hypothetical protein [Thiobacillus thioparus]|uniref:hypothetical protein n=1 Tax=Thiobacillus thioparus TaxID=931 RepID=UPI0014613DF3|nr:hypothetical protein [Thiobacillus thioparus]